MNVARCVGITTLLVSLTAGGSNLEHTDLQISSLIDTWLLLRDLELNGERNRVMYVLKSRGMAHSNQMREFRLTNHGIELVDGYLGAGGVLTGASRLAQEARDLAQQTVLDAESTQQRAVIERKRKLLDSRIAALRAEFAADETETRVVLEGSRLRDERLGLDREAMGRSRQRDGAPAMSGPGNGHGPRP